MRIFPTPGWLQDEATDRAVRRRSPGARRWVEASLLGSIFAYGGLLRFEALYRKYWTVFAKEGFVRLQTGLAELASSVRPASFAWIRDESLIGGHYPYVMDQRGFIDMARSAGHFYDARFREPLFVFSTKAALALTNGHEIALSLASTTFSALVVLAAWALGRAMGGAVAGLLAAFLVAIHRDMIWWATDGWRADLLTGLTALFAYACVRLYRRPSRAAALLVGVSGGLVCLTRITSLSFVVPALVFLCVAHARQGGVAREGRGFASREGRTGAPAEGSAGRPGVRDGWWKPCRHDLLAGAVALVLVAPFVVNCWIAYGDPLYAIGAHSRRIVGEEVSGGAAPSLGSYLLSRDPVVAADSILRGLTVYAWSNKWHGLGAYWGSWLADTVAMLSLLGLMIWLWNAEGRLLLLILVTSLVPFAVAWEVPGGAEWRFTMHSYPFFVVAAVDAAAALARRLRGLRRRRGRLLERLEIRLRPVVITAVLVGGVASLVYTMPLLEVFHELSLGRGFSIAAGRGDAFFFTDDWRPAVELGNQTVRHVVAKSGSVRIPMLGGRAYGLTIRMEPVLGEEEVSRVVDVSLNGRRLGRLRVRHDPQRMGSYRLSVPAGWAATGFNGLEITTVSTRGVAESETTFLVWYVRVEPER